MRIVFMGSAPLACACLRTLLEAGRDEVVSVVTQPDRPKGRRLKLTPCAVKNLARDAGIPVWSPERVNARESLDRIASMQPEVVAVVAYGQFLGASLLALPPRGCINMHASLLPRYRGAAPIQWAIVNGDAVTGVTSMHMNERMDAGDMIFQETAPILGDDTAATLHDRLAERAGALLVRTLDALGQGTAPRIPQDDREATYAPKLSKEDGRIDWTQPAQRIYNMVRAFTPWPGAFCACPGDPGSVLKVLGARVEAFTAERTGRGCGSGRVVGLGPEGPLVLTGEGCVRLLEVQPAGGKAMSAGAYLCGHGVRVGSCLAWPASGKRKDPCGAARRGRAEHE